MKKLVIVLAIALAIPLVPCHAETIKDILNSFTQETQVTFLNNSFHAFGIDFNNGSNDVINGTSILQTGPGGMITVDSGLVTPTQSSQVGTALIGASIHADRVLNTYAPSVIKWLEANAPNSSQKVLSTLFIGAAPIYNFNYSTNQRALKLEVYSGVELKFQ